MLTMIENTLLIGNLLTFVSVDHFVCLDIQVFWIQKSSQTILTSDDRVEVDNIINEIVDGQTKYDIQKRPLLDMTTYMLIIRRLVLTDAGTYTCQINVKAALDHPSKDGIIVVQGNFSNMQLAVVFFQSHQQ